MLKLALREEGLLLTPTEMFDTEMPGMVNMGKFDYDFIAQTPETYEAIHRGGNWVQLWKT
jgi:hypothetical protein